MNLLPHPEFKWKDDVVLYGMFDENAWFTPASISHFMSGFILFYIIKKLFNYKNYQTIIIANLLHAIEDYMENTSTISLEAIAGQIVGCKNTLLVETNDKDCIQNFLGDIISFLLGSLLAYNMTKRKNINNFIYSNLVYVIGTVAIIWIYACKYLPVPKMNERKDTGI